MKIYILRRILLFSCLFLQFELGGQTYILGEGPSTIFTCGGTLLDPGGTSDYENNLDVTQTICPQNAGESIRLSFTSFGTEACCDKLTIYEGGSTNGPILGVLAGNIQPGIFISSTFGNGCLTLNFETDGSIIVGSGFEASISCVPSPASITLGEGNDTLYGCSFIITDPGGAGNYGPNENVVQTFCSDSGACLKLDFQLIHTEAQLDVLSIYDGPGIESQLIANLSGFITNPEPVQSSTTSGGCLTMVFSSNNMNQLSGFRASLSCIDCGLSPVILGQGDSIITGCAGRILDPGGYGHYPNNASVIQTFCSGIDECVKIEFNNFETVAMADRLFVYDGIDTTAALLAIYSGIDYTYPLHIQSSDESGGCLTFMFLSNSSLNNVGFDASVSCVPCQAPPIILGQGGTITGCEIEIIDPGGILNYPNNSNSVQTFCSGNGECLKLDFQSFETQAFVDVLSIYDGPSTGSQLIASFSGHVPNPSSVISSNASEGCLTLRFTSNSTGNFPGFMATLSCISCAPPPIILGQGNNVIPGCAGMILDPGGYGIFPNNSTVIQTFCSGTNDCIRIHFNEFATQNNSSRLSIYDGPNTTQNLLAIYSGFSMSVPPSVQSSTASGGCLTLEFTSGNSFNPASGFSANISCIECDEPIVQNNSPVCADMQQICNFDTLSFWGNLDLDSELGPSISCLGVARNPSWFWFKTAQSGTVNLRIFGNHDIDFICWGPFSEEQFNQDACSFILNPEWAENSENIADCSFSATNNELLSVLSTMPNQHFVVMVSNFANLTQQISIVSDSGSAAIDCSQLCSINSELEVSECDSINNTYTITGSVLADIPVNSGFMNILNSNGGITSHNAPFDSVFVFQIDDIAADGMEHQIELSFSFPGYCSETIVYQAPATCSACPVFASIQEIICENSDVQLNSTLIDGATYLWSGPNNFSSTEQNPILNHVESIDNGVYTVTISDSANNCSSFASLNLSVNPLPILNIGNDFTVCASSIVTIGSLSNYEYSYSWSPEIMLNYSDTSMVNASITNFSNEPIIQDFICTASRAGCEISDTLTGTFLPVIPPFELQVLGNGPQFYIDIASDSVLWFILNFPEPFAVNQDSVISPFSNILHRIYAAVVNEFGCVTYSDTLLFDPVSIYGLDAFQINIFPNPAESQITIEAPVSSNFTLRDASGRIVREGFLKEKSTQILISDLSGGIYIVEVANHLGRVNQRISILRN